MTAEKAPEFTNFKGPKGALQLAAKARRRAARASEDEQKAIVRERDHGRCRWPDCRHRGVRLEVAHLVAKGMGGDHGIRSTADQMVLLCFFHHQADPQDGHPEGSIERHNLRIEPLTDMGSNGPLRFLRERITTGPLGMVQEWIEVARESAPGVLMR